MLGRRSMIVSALASLFGFRRSGLFRRSIEEIRSDDDRCNKMFQASKYQSSARYEVEVVVRDLERPEDPVEILKYDVSCNDIIIGCREYPANNKKLPRIRMEFVDAEPHAVSFDHDMEDRDKNAMLSRLLNPKLSRPEAVKARATYYESKLAS